MAEHETKEFIRKAQLVQAMQFLGWAINLDEICAWIVELGADYQPDSKNNRITVISDAMSQDLTPGMWVIKLGDYDFEICSDFDLPRFYDRAEPVKKPQCQKPIGYTGGTCGNMASYVFTLDAGIETHRCKAHMATNLTKMELTNNELMTIQKI